jgi:hypothetical protein
MKGANNNKNLENMERRTTDRIEGSEEEDKGEE